MFASNGVRVVAGWPSAKHSALGRATIGAMTGLATGLVLFDDRSSQPSFDHPQHRTIGDAHANSLQQLVMRDRVEVPFQVRASEVRKPRYSTRQPSVPDH